MNKQQLLRDPDVKPTEEAIANALGAAAGAYAKLNEEIPKHDIQVDWRYYKDGNAWLGKALHKWTTSRGTQKEITAFWLSVWDGFFRVGFTFPEKYRADVLALPLDKTTLHMIEESGQMGKLKIFPLAFDMQSEERFPDVFTLVEFKKSKR